MLVLSRKAGESIVIGEGIEVTVLNVGNKVSIGITAPDEVRIVRSELLEEHPTPGVPLRHGLPVPSRCQEAAC